MFHSASGLQDVRLFKVATSLPSVDIVHCDFNLRQGTTQALIIREIVAEALDTTSNDTAIVYASTCMSVPQRRLH